MSFNHVLPWGEETQQMPQQTGCPATFQSPHAKEYMNCKAEGPMFCNKYRQNTNIPRVGCQKNDPPVSSRCLSPSHKMPMSCPERL